MDGFHSETLEDAYERLNSVFEEIIEVQDDIAELDTRLKGLKIPLFIKEYDIGPSSIKLEWNDTLGYLVCTYDGRETRLRDLPPEAMMKVYKHLPDFLHALANYI